MAGVLIDTGPLVAILSVRDASHDICVECLRDLTPPLFTCWPVLTEAAWLLRRYPAALLELLSSCDPGLLTVLDLDGAAPRWIARFLARYRKLRAQLADAALVYLAERDGFEVVFTLDRRDFSVYRLTDNRALQLFPDR